MRRAESQGRDARTLILAVVAVVVVVGAFWCQHGYWSADPVRALARFLVAPLFMGTAALLRNQEGQRNNMWLLVAGALTWTAEETTYRTIGGLTSAAFVIGGYTPVVISAVLLRYPSSRSDRSLRIYFWVNATAATLLHCAMVVTLRPQWWGYGRLPWPTLWPNRSAMHDLQFVRYVWWSAGALTFCVLFARRWAKARRFERHLIAPIVWSTGVVALGFAVAPVQHWLSPRGDESLDLLRTFGAAGVALAFVVSAVRMRLDQSDVGVLAARLAERPSMGEVEDGLRAALRDDHLTVLYWVPEQAAYVASDGLPTALQPDGEGERLVIEVADTEGNPLAVVRADPSLRPYRRLMDAALAVSRLALENARLEAGLRAQLVAVRDARARLLHSGLQQRRQLERDLHDGAQQRLMAVGMRLGAIEAVSGRSQTAAEVQLARKELHLALDELRDLAHGIYPAVLTQAGLGPAVEAVADRLPLAVEISVPERRWHADVESAAYLVVCEALTNAAKHAGPCQARVQVDSADDDLVVCVADDGEGAPLLEDERGLAHLRDRIETLGGQFWVTSTAGQGTRIEARIPCV